MSETAAFRTDPDHERLEYRGRTYAIPFDRVWSEAGRVISRMRGWTLQDADDEAGRLTAKAEGWLLKATARITVRIGLDENGQTRVDLESIPEKGNGGRRTARRRTRKFFRELDGAVDAEGRMTLDVRTTALLIPLLLASACGSDGDLPNGAEAPTADSTEVMVVDPGPAERWERAFAFVSVEADSILSMLWSSEAASRPTGVVRAARGSVHFAGNWQELHRASYSTDPSPNPWRIIPDATLGIIVDDADGVEEVFFRGDGPRAHLVIGERLNEWNSTTGGQFLLSSGTLRLGEREEAGFAVDLTRTWEDSRGRVPGDWGLLVSGDSLAVLMQNSSAATETWRVWARRGVESSTWPAVTVTRGAVRAFDRARRDVPVSWTLSTEAGDMAGVLDLRTADLVAGEGDGPLLPVDGFFEVAGTLTVDGVEVPVHGLIRHQQR